MRIYEYLLTTLHAKTFVVDGLWVSVGTMNFDNRSLALNDESTLMVLDSAAGQRMESVFMDDLRDAREIDLARSAAARGPSGWRSGGRINSTRVL